MLNKILIIALILITNRCIGQGFLNDSTLKSKLVLTKEQNQNWYDSLKKLSKNEQLNFIVKRVTLDTNIFIRHSYADGIKVNYSSQEKTKFQGFCTPLIVIEELPLFFHFDDKFEDYYKKIRETDKFIKMMKNIVIDNLQILLDKSNTAIYGTDGEYGTILLKVSNKESLKSIRKLYGLTN